MKHKFGEQVEAHIAKTVIDGEYALAKQDNTLNLDFEAVVDMLECRRTEKDYEWMSDVFIPELPSIIMTEASSWANQYFQTRDFVRAKVEGTGTKKLAQAKAAEKCVNATLNRKGLFHYPKYIRARMINALIGYVYALCWWEQKVVQMQIGTEEETILTNPEAETELERYTIQSKPVYKEAILIDQFNYEVLDPRNVFTDSKYTYSVQQKDWVTIRTESSLEKLRQNEKALSYFNLDVVKEFAKGNAETETQKETRGNEPEQNTFKTPVKNFDLLQRFGKFYCIVEERDEYGNAKKVKPGLDENGEPLENAELVETIISYVLVNGKNVLIRFQATPYIDKFGNPYKPLIRGLCYIHPTKDMGLSDGLFSRELQKAINDTFNMASDRVKLATLPTFKGRKQSLEDNSTVYFEPEHVILLDDPQTDLQEINIQEDTHGAIQQIAVLTNKLQQVTSVYPTTMGQLPGQASTTATAIAGADTRANLRANFKSLTFEYTFLTDLYWMILQMTYAFAKEATALKLMDDSVYDFEPNGDYVYAPVSANIEMEYNKYKKLTLINQMIGRVVNIPDKNTPKVLNYLLQKAFELLGSEFPDYKDALLSGEPAPERSQAPNQAQMPDMNIQPVTNQQGVPMSTLEEFVRK